MHKPLAFDALRRGFGGFKGEANWMIAMTIVNGVSSSFVWFLFTLYLEELLNAPEPLHLLPVLYYLRGALA